MFSGTQTWTTVGTTYTGLLNNVTGTAYAANSKLFNFQLSGSDVFHLNLTGSYDLYLDGPASGNVRLMMRGNGGTTNVQQVVDSSGNWYIDQYSAATVGFKIGGVDKFIVSNTAGNGATITAGTATTAVNALSLTQTWSNAAVTFDAISSDITATAKNAASTLLNLKVGGTSEFLIRGSTYTASSTTELVGPLYLSLRATTGIDINLNGTTVCRWGASQLQMGTYVLGWSASGPGFSNTVGLSYISAGIVGIGTGAAGSTAGTLYVSTINACSTYYGPAGVNFGSNSGGVIFTASGSTLIALSQTNNGFVYNGTYSLGFVSGAPVHTSVSDVALSRLSAGNMALGTGAAGSFAGRLKLTSTIVAATTVAALNASPTIGEISTVNDALAVTAKGATVTAGGSAIAVLVWNGTNWVGI